MVSDSLRELLVLVVAAVSPFVVGGGILVFGAAANDITVFLLLFLISALNSQIESSYW